MFSKAKGSAVYSTSEQTRGQTTKKAKHNLLRSLYLHFRGVIPAKAGILTRIALHQDHIAVDNYAGIP